MSDMEVKAKVSEMRATPCAEVLGITHDNYVALVDIVEDFVTAEPDTIATAYEETRNNVMRRFDVDETKADEYINIVCSGIAMDALNEIAMATPPQQVASFTPDIAIINTTRSVGALSIIRTASDIAHGEGREEYLDTVKKIADEAGFNIDVTPIAEQQIPQLIMLLALYPAFALGILDEKFVLTKIKEYCIEHKVTPLITKNNMRVIFVIAAANEKAFATKDGE